MGLKGRTEKIIPVFCYIEIGNVFTGYYVYIESSSPRKKGDKARISKQYTSLPAGGSCLSFWYHMFGSHTGRLNVYVRKSASGSLGNTSWSMIGQQGNKWVKGQVSLPGTTANVSI